MKLLSFLYLTYFSKAFPHFRHDIHSFWNNEQKIGIIDTQNNVQELFPNRTKPVRSYHHPSYYITKNHPTSNCLDITNLLMKHPILRSLGKHFQIQWDDTTLNEFTMFIRTIPSKRVWKNTT